METRTVLVVEDDPESANLVRITLEEAGFTVESLANGADALRRINAGGIDLTLTDVGIPGLNGYDLLDRVHLTKPALPVIVMTASCNPQVTTKATALGAVAVLQKPFDSLKEVVRAVQQAIAGKA